MDGIRFDRLARAFARVGTRRQVVAGAAVVAVGVGGLEAADAKVKHPCRAGRQTCQRDNQCCSGTCRRGVEVPLKDRNRCACGDGETQCGNACVDLAHDERNCGACGTRCRTGDLCCPDGCVDTKTDEQNCGACGNACGDGDACCGGTCVALDSDADNCGACGHACGRGGVCVSGRCDYPNACPEAWQEDTWYCVASVEGKAFVDGDGPASISKLADWGSDAADCQTSADCDQFTLCGLSSVECACITGDWWTADAFDPYPNPSCIADVKRYACSDPDATAGFPACYENVEGDVWGATSGDFRFSTWVCQSSDQCDGDWDPLCDNPEYGCGCVFSLATTPGQADIYGMNARCVRDRVVPA